MSEHIIVGGSLCHYGKKGMKWGVRKQRDTDNKSTKRVVIKKGSEIYRTTDVKEQHKGHAYVTTNKKDAAAYRGWGDVHATYKALEDIVIPTKNEQVKAACELIKNDKEVRMAVAKAQIGFTSGNYKKLTKMSLDEIGGRPYNTFVATIDENKTVRDKYMTSLAKKGYNAVLDVMDEGLMADMPLIIFDRAKTLSEAAYD